MKKITKTKTKKLAPIVRGKVALCFDANPPREIVEKANVVIVFCGDGGLAVIKNRFGHCYKNLIDELEMLKIL